MTVPLEGYEAVQATAAGKTRTVYRAGSGPAVIVLTELPGITPSVAAFGQRLVAIGCTAVLPQLFGRPGRPPSGGYLLRSFAQACISREFAVFAAGRTSPIADWLRAFAREEHARCGGPGVGVVGMCFTGNLALAVATEAAVLAPVLSQPSLPLGGGAAKRASAGVSTSDALAARRHLETIESCAIGLRFTGDRLVPADRFATLRELLGDRFVGVEIDSGAHNGHGISAKAHSVLTENLVDEPGHPTRAALDDVLGLFRRRLLGEAA